MLFNQTERIGTASNKQLLFIADRVAKTSASVRFGDDTTVAEEYLKKSSRNKDNNQ